MLLAFDPEWQIFATLLGYSAAVILASVLGGLLPEWIRLTHNRMQIMISFVGGVMLGIAVFHMIPHALASLGGDRIDQVMWGLMLGMLTTFFLLRSFHFHHHEPAHFGLVANEQALKTAEAADPRQPTAPDQTHGPSHSHAHSEDCSGHGHHHAGHGHHAADVQRGTTRWMAVLVGLGLHTLMDGVALSSGVVAEAGHIGHGILPGFGIFLAVLLHKPLDAVSITSLMHPVTTPSRRMMVNIGFALMCPLGAFLFWIGASQLSGAWGTSLAGWGLAFSAGVFLCISLSDLLPEMEFHSHSRIQLTAALLLGIAAALAIGLVEGEHAHSHSHSHAPAADEQVVVEPTVAGSTALEHTADERVQVARP